VLEPAKRRPLPRHEIRVHRVDLNNPAKAVRLVRLLADVKALVVVRPLVGALRHAVALVGGRLRMIGWKLAREVAVKILFA